MPSIASSFLTIFLCSVFASDIFFSPFRLTFEVNRTVTITKNAGRIVVHVSNLGSMGIIYEGKQQTKVCRAASLCLAAHTHILKLKYNRIKSVEDTDFCSPHNATEDV